MQIVKAIVDSSRLESILNLPEEYRNRKLQILILPLPQATSGKEASVFNPDEFEGVLSMDASTLEKELRHMRDEWERI